jgi:hypothetical protein
VLLKVARHEDAASSAPDATLHQVTRDPFLDDKVEAGVKTVESSAAHHGPAKAGVVDVAVYEPADLARLLKFSVPIGAMSSDVMNHLVLEYVITPQAISEVQDPELVVEIDLVEKAPLEEI